ncbi:hypothetical protein PAXRUDRAFT_823342 [Paxillus rubicundulus Ve08.2h10]|uniref:Unplaced genomic scaffold scaffold_54, whole genome shotgun sequence n=1 Tax=Paxillus rubicundulus Ve08.2h10 TaxID=930991 RepID=A0A0D0E8Y3_9AGAM|nr:hypothetical protein PAXRUDRAFT_823342 [Paxillus rubicundulus Ve08.2h10]
MDTLSATKIPPVMTSLASQLPFFRIKPLNCPVGLESSGPETVLVVAWLRGWAPGIRVCEQLEHLSIRYHHLHTANGPRLPVGGRQTCVVVPTRASVQICRAETASRVAQGRTTELMGIGLTRSHARDTRNIQDAAKALSSIKAATTAISEQLQFQSEDTFYVLRIAPETTKWRRWGGIVGHL